MRVVFTIAVISAFVVLRFVIQVLWRVLFADKHTQENFEVGDKTSHMELFASILQEVKKVKDFTKRFDAMDVESTYVFSQFFTETNSPFIVPTIVQGRSALSGRIPATHPYYDTFVNMSKMYEEVPENTKSKLTFASSNWKGITDKVFERIDIPAKGDCIVQISESLSSIHPLIIFAMFERLAVTKINNKDPVLDTLAKSVQNTDELEYQLRGTRRENQELQMKLKNVETVQTCQSLVDKFKDAERSGDSDKLKFATEDLLDNGCGIPKTVANPKVMAARRMSERTQKFNQNRSTYVKYATDVSGALENTVQWSEHRSESVAVLLEGDISASMRARLHNDKQIIDSIRSEYMRLKTEASRKDKFALFKLQRVRAQMSQVVIQLRKSLQEIF
jgi:hypothetical protein